ncbi:hypothetical protein [Flaviflagellibacter deserti]|uniref:Uncharacterized protein n=1 Tax=Flaviflagellibacter deserti TaxID=2267266 RepID=A0ABV9YZJ3_9HYPH
MQVRHHLPIAFIVVALASPAMAQTDSAARQKVERYARDLGATFTSDPALRDAIRVSTRQHRKFGYPETLAEDARWRNEMAADRKGPRPLVDSVFNNPVSAKLKDIVSSAPGGAVVDIQVTDGYGWNVAQTAPTSDFYQGDERAWQSVISAEPDKIVLSAPETGDGRILIQAALPVVDGESVIGAIAIVVDAERVPQ